MANNPSISLLMTRPLAAAQAFVQSLPDEVGMRVTPCYSPLLQIVGLDFDPKLTTEEAVIFTSTNGVRFAPQGDGRPAFCVGRATTQAARDCGWDAQLAGHDVTELITTLQKSPPGQSLVHLRGVHSRGEVSNRLPGARAVLLYDQLLCDLTPEARGVLADPTPTLVPLFSPRTAIQFFDQTPSAENATYLALSPAVADCAPAKLRPKVIVCSPPDAQSMRQQVAKTVSGMTPG